MWQFVAVIPVYFRPTETPISAETEISPKPPISDNTENEISVYHYALVSHHSVFRSYNPPFLGFLFDFVITMLELLDICFKIHE